MSSVLVQKETDSCEAPCQCCDSEHSCELIVLTGGPGAGKTAVLEAARKVLCQHVAILPEAASIVFGGGFWRLESQNAKKSSQRAIFHIQQEMESLVVGEKKWGIGLCDRGTLDGLAYWTDTEECFWSAFNTSREKEFSRYNFELANTDNLFKIFDMIEKESKSLIENKLSLPAYDQCLKASHIFNILDARGVISVAQRAEFIARIRDLAKGVGQIWLESQK